MSYLMFHWVTGIPFQAEFHGGAYDDLTLWEQIDEGAHYTPAKKWLFCVPILLCVTTAPRLSMAGMLTPISGSSRLHTTHTTTRGCSPSICPPSSSSSSLSCHR